MQSTPIYKLVRDEKRQRIAWYRQQVAQLQQSANSETGPENRDYFLEMAMQYEGLARRLEEDLGGQ